MYGSRESQLLKILLQLFDQDDTLLWLRRPMYAVDRPCSL